MSRSRRLPWVLASGRQAGRRSTSSIFCRPPFWRCAGRWSRWSSNFSLTPDLVLVDGNRDPHLGLQTRTVVKGDGTSACIAAASILAKVTRDRQMVELDRQYPQYGFAKHKGYPTKQHYACIEQYGISPVHRRSFLKKLLQD